jgi:hypothetical protein
MTQDFRPTIEQVEYLNTDMQEHLAELGLDVENNEYSIRWIVWYNWDDKPRWFAYLDITNLVSFKRAGYVEVDIYAEAWNGPEHCMGIDRIEIADHGYPCMSVPVVGFDQNEGYYFIEE